MRLQCFSAVYVNCSVTVHPCAFSTVCGCDDQEVSFSCVAAAPALRNLFQFFMNCTVLLERSAICVRMSGKGCMASWSSSIAVATWKINRQQKMRPIVNNIEMHC